MIDTALPKHLEISEALIRDIRAGRLADGMRLPPERQLAAARGVAVGTLRKALALVAAEGMLERRQGSGNYVRRREGPHGVYGFFRLELPEGGGLPTADVISLETGDFGPSGPGHRVRRLRRLDGVAVALEEVLVNGTLVPSLEGLGDSLYRHYAQVAGLQVVRVEDRVGCGAAPDWGAGLLGEGPLGLVDRQARDEAGGLIEQSRTWFDPGKARYVNRME